MSRWVDLEQQFRAAAAEYDQIWRAADDVLYELCRRNPGHQQLDAVLAKVMIIGRTYAGGLERVAGRDRSEEPPLIRVARFIHSNGTEFDEAIEALRPVTFPPTPADQIILLREHDRLTSRLAEATRGSRPRSFVSKYLHFHVPTVPIFDSIALQRIGWYISHADAGNVRRRPNADLTYAGYLSRLLVLHRWVTDACGPKAVSLKHLDHFLWSSR
jgi:hypothetical protein